MNSAFKNIYPRQNWTNENYYNIPQQQCNNDQRLGGFLIPFLTGAAISAPFWLVAGSNKPQNNFYPYPPNQYPYYPVYMNNYPTQPYISYNK